MAGWTTLDELLSREIEQSLEEGKPAAQVQTLREAFERGPRDNAAMTQLQTQLVALPVRPDFPFDEPNGLAEIQALRRNPVNFTPPAIDERLADQLHGAWLGRCGGCALGKPVELIGLCPPAAVRQKTWRDIKRYLTAISPDEWPIKDFIPLHSPAAGEMTRLVAPDSTRERINHMESDDDIRYTVLGQLVMAEKGATFTTEDVADKWFQNLPYRAVCTAETQAYRNLIVRYDTHESTQWSVGSADGGGIDWDWVASHLNPYREWIGAQIRVDSYAYAAPGNPALAADFAWRDARLSHVKNGIYGAMACAAMIAAAFATSDVKKVVAAGLGEIPATSRIHAEMLEVVALCERFDNDWQHHEAVFDGICELLGHYSAIHTNNNLGVIIASLLLSGGDYH
ncbi:MAG: ADP-ribosylglycohydrolase family protein, partial [Chitinophagaceae bacterium]|nr:ADP-ribosylglycohydrolase family protein [Rubrivivax sp.]